MKKFFLICVINLLLITSAIATNMPSWYINRDFKQPESNEILGYGEDRLLQNAIFNAKTDISMQLKSRIESSLIQNKYQYNDRLSSNAHQRQKVSTDEILKDTMVIKQEQIDGKWFVVVTYENIPDLHKFIKKLPNNLENDKQNRYLKNTLLFRELNDILGKSINVRLYFNNNGDNNGTFQLGYKTMFQNIDLNVPDLFVNHNTNNSNTFKINKESKFSNIILKFEPVSFEFSSKKKFVSLFAISPEGRVLLLEDNINAVSRTDGYMFKKLKPAEERNTLFVAVFSDKKIDNSYFRYMTGNESDESYIRDNIKFHTFVDFLNNEDLDFISTKMTIKER